MPAPEGTLAKEGEQGEQRGRLHQAGGGGKGGRTGRGWGGGRAGICRFRPCPGCIPARVRGRGPLSASLRLSVALTRSDSEEP